jgi:hypothetical protein
LRGELVSKGSSCLIKGILAPNIIVLKSICSELVVELSKNISKLLTLEKP